MSLFFRIIKNTLKNLSSHRLYIKHIINGNHFLKGTYFDKTREHYNPTNAMHPYHAGDMVALLGNNGFAYQVFYDKRFSTQEIIGKSVIIHNNMDDFISQPSGNSGSKIGCGVIRRF